MPFSAEGAFVDGFVHKVHERSGQCVSFRRTDGQLEMANFFLMPIQMRGNEGPLHVDWSVATVRTAQMKFDSRRPGGLEQSLFHESGIHLVLTRRLAQPPPFPQCSQRRPPPPPPCYRRNLCRISFSAAELNGKTGRAQVPFGCSRS